MSARSSPPSADEKPETLIYSDAGDGAMRMVSVEENSTLITHFDGRPAVIDAKAAEPRTLAIKAVSPTRYSWTFSVAGTPASTPWPPTARRSPR